MTAEVIAALVDEGAALDTRIKAEQERLKQIKADLIKHVDETEGLTETMTILAGDSGRIAKIISPDPTLKPKDEQIEAAREMIADEPTFKKLFEKLVSYKPVKSFREVAGAILGKKAGKLIELCEVESAPYVIFG